MAEWLGTGLQNLLQQFDSASHLQKTPVEAVLRGLFFFNSAKMYRELHTPKTFIESRLYCIFYAVIKGWEQVNAYDVFKLVNRQAAICI